MSRARSRSSDNGASHPPPGTLRGAAPGVLAFVTVGAVSTVDGGYFPHTWGWVTLLLVFVAGAALVLAERVEIGIFELSLLGTATLLVGWVALSAAWSDSLPRTVLELQRDLVYLAALGALVALACRGCATSTFVGVLGASAAVAAYALATRLLPDRLGYEGSDGYRLARPLGYWNSLAILAAMGVVLAVGFAAHARTRTVRAVAAALLPILLTTLSFTFSRGAWIALAAGVFATVALSPRRVELIAEIVVLAPPSVLAIWLGSRFEGLAERASLEATVDSGRRFAALLLGLAALSALLSGVGGRVAQRLRIGVRARRAIGVAGAGAAVAVVLVAAGNPGSLAGRVSDAFRGPVPAAGEGLGERLLSVSGSGRNEYWSIAWSEYTANPVLGSGAGTYEVYWTRDRPNPFDARDAHSLYLETLAELGPVGLLLLTALLATPLAAFGLGRRTALSAAALGAYVTFLAHAGIDWDWEIPAVTLAALFCGGGVVIAAGPRRARTLTTGALAGALALITLAGAFAFVTAIGNGALAASERAVLSGRAVKAEAEAHKATRWAPWSAEAWLALGRAQRVQGRGRDARASFERGIERDQLDWRLWYELARVSGGAAGDAALGEAARLNPRSPDLTRSKGAERSAAER